MYVCTVCVILDVSMYVFVYVYEFMYVEFREVVPWFGNKNMYLNSISQ